MRPGRLVRRAAFIVGLVVMVGLAGFIVGRTAQADTIQLVAVGAKDRRQADHKHPTAQGQGVLAQQTLPKVIAAIGR